MRPTPDLGGPVSRRSFDGRVVLNGLTVVKLDGTEFLAIA